MNFSPSTVATVCAPAKINLYFHITGRQADGYHLVDSLIGFTTLGDELTIRAGKPLDIVSDGLFAGGMPPPKQNLVYQALQLLAKTAGAQANAHVTITKNLPVAAGIGGGSSDAAAAMKAMAVLWEISDVSIDLFALGLSLGSDVPACLKAQPTYASGIGEVLDEAPQLPRAGILLVNPGVPLVTSSVFHARRGGFKPFDRFDTRPKDAAALAALLAYRGNDLTDAAVQLCPIIRNVLVALEAAPGCHLARMTGSGASCFGIFDDLAAAKFAAPTVSRDGWWVAPTELNTAAS